MAEVQRIAERLQADYDFVQRGDWLQKGRCPECGKRELYTRVDGPWVIRCGRQNKCGWEDRAKNLYPDEFEGFNRRYQPTDENPRATADAYLRSQRGIDPERIQGWYEQGSFWHPHGDRGTATVRFYLRRDPVVYMERFIEPVKITGEDGETETRRAQFKGRHTGLWWTPPKQTIEDGDEVWITEGILDAICLALAGRKVAATLSAGHYPAEALAEHEHKDVTWVWAMDADAAGRKATAKHVHRMREAGLSVSAAQPPAGQDWNDLHQRERLATEDLETYRYYGALLIARTAADKAALIYGRTGRDSFHFEHEHRTFWFSLDLEKYSKAIHELLEAGTMTEEEARERALYESQSLKEIANCAIEFLYYQRYDLTDESWYYTRITTPHNHNVKAAFSGAALASASEFKKRLISACSGAVWTGSSGQLDALLKDRISGIKTVETVDFLGYSPDHETWVFPEVAIRRGEVYERNAEDYFQVGRGRNKVSLKSLNESLPLHINPERADYEPEWSRWLLEAYGQRGLMVLVWWFGTLFAEQIRSDQKSWPFLELVGEPGSGKSTLIEFLWKLVGRRDYEGFDPAKATPAARARTFAQVSNLPIGLIEADRDGEGGKRGGWDWDELKTAFNGRSVRSRGVKSGGNETYDPPFRGGVLISQNARVDASEAILQRIVHITLDKGGHTPESRAAAEKLERTPVEQVSRFVVEATTREAEVLKTVREQKKIYERMLLQMDDLHSVRIAHNHAQMMALVDALAPIIGLKSTTVEDARDWLAEMALERQRTISADHALVAEFWEVFDYLNNSGDVERLNHSKRDDTIALRLNEVMEVAAKHHQHLPDMALLKAHLPGSKSRPYVAQRGVRSAMHTGADGAAKVVHCWIFERPSHQKSH